MRHRWAPATLLFAVLISACSNGKSESLSEAEGRQAADKARRPVAEVYWQLYNSIGGSASRGVAPDSLPTVKRSERIQ